jgi:hypothetical protein
MNSSNHLKEYILSHIYNYFPKNINDSTELYWETREFLNLKNKCKEVSEDNLNWSNFYDRIREHFPYYLIIDQTQYLDFDRCNSLVITFKNEINDIRYFQIFVSYIVPCYLICLTETTGNKDFKYNIDPLDQDGKTLFDLNIIRKTLLGFFPYQTVDESIGKSIVDDIAFQNLDFGEVSIYKAIFTNYIFF